MSESVRRRKYRYDRVLIETDRVLSPQFDDAVVYLTGAQLEMLRNVSQYLNRLDTYVTEYNPGYYIAPTVEDYDDILEIVADLEEALMGNPNTIWGYFDRWYWWSSVLGDGTSPLAVSTIPVPAGYVYVLEHWQIYHNAGQTCTMNLGMGATSSDPLIYTAPAIPSGESVIQAANLTMKVGDILTNTIYGLPATKRAYLHVWGHMMVVPA